MKLVIWLSVLTDHQLHTFRALQEFLPNQIVYVVGSRILAARELQGWNVAPTEGLALEFLPERGWWNKGRKILNRYPDAIHIFGGLWADRRFFPMLLLVQATGIASGLMMEPFADRAQSYFGFKPTVFDQLKAKFRPLVYRLAGFFVVRRLLVAFPIAEKAIGQLQGIGVNSERIFPFGYFVPTLKLGLPRESRDDLQNKSSLRVVFVGSLIVRKGLSTLLNAIKLCHSHGRQVSLDVYGPGKPELINLSGQQVCYRGVIPFGETQKIVAMYDLLVLPSFHDGWGVVVNEALLQGVPVLVSDECGAKALVQSSGAGKVFPAGNVEVLSELLEGAIAQPDTLQVWRDAAVSYGKYLSPEIAGEYLFKCLENASGAATEKPTSPWYSFLDNGHAA